MLTLFAGTCLWINAATALGINCQGSFNCEGGFQSLQNFQDLESQIDPDRLYDNEEHIMCDGVDTNSICLFPQGTESGLLGSSIPGLINALVDHGCAVCGSVPIFFPGSNDPSEGILTSNWVNFDDGCDVDESTTVCP